MTSESSGRRICFLDVLLSGTPLVLEGPLPLVMSIQSKVALVHVGNSTAAYPMDTCGAEVVEVPTTLLSNNPHYRAMRGRLLESDFVADILAGPVGCRFHERAAVVLSGFMGRGETGSAVAGF